MSPERYTKIRALFEQALEMPKERRADFVGAAAGDNEIEEAVLRLLDADAASAPALDAPEHLDTAAISTGLILSTPYPPGYVLGPYTIIKLLGFGGMGAVYLASRNDQAFTMSVAIKVPRADLTGTGFAERLLAERRILAALDHPNIARLLDAGTSPDGRPYYVMEYVPGVPITQYFNTLRVNLRTRLLLFLKVCDAVSYAHRSLIVHRDLKPSNILVRADSAVKLLDFGIAKLLAHAPESVDSPDLALSLRIFTPQYASPEQFRGDRITTATDQYSLGTILYELLTGQHPFHVRPANLHLIARVICEQEPVSPSLAVLKAGRPGELQAGMAGAIVASQRLSRALRGDLDTIVMKSLHKDPADRYLSVEDFQQDIRRYLNGLPIRATPPKLLYRAGKFIRRHPAATIIVSLVVLMAIASSLEAFFQVIRARDAARKNYYTAGIVAADALIRDHDYDAARQSLLRLPAPERQWEWKYLYSLLDTSIGTLYTSGDAVDPQFSGAIRLDDTRNTVSWNSGNVLHIWNSLTFQRIARQSAFGHIYGFSPHGHILAASGPDFRLRPESSLILFNAESEREMGRLNIQPSHLARLAFDTEQDRIAIADREGHIGIANSSTGAPISSFAVTGGPVVYVAFVPGSNALIVQAGSSMRILDCASGKVIRAIGQVPALATAVALEPSGQRLAMAAVNHLLILDLKQRAKPTDISLSEPVSAAAFGRDPTSIIVATGEGRISIIDVNTRATRQVLWGHKRTVTDLHVEPAGVRLFSSDGREIKVWDLRTRDGLRLLEGIDGYATAITVTPDGALVAASFSKPVASGESTVRLPRGPSTVGIWNAAAQLVNAFSVNGPVLTLQFSPNKEHLAVATVYGPIDIVSARSGLLENELAPREPPFWQPTTGGRLAFSSDGKYLAALSNRSLLLIYALDRPGDPQSYFPEQVPVQCGFRFLGDHQYLATIGDRVRLWPFSELTSPVELTFGGARSRRPAVNVDIGAEPSGADRVSGCAAYGTVSWV